MPYELQSASGSGPSGTISCKEFDALLADAIDSALGGQQLERFNAHAAVCRGCGAALQEARAGREWLSILESVEPPATLLHNILAQTSHAESYSQPASDALPPLAGWFGGLRRLLSGSLQPRFATTFGMAFFSLSLMFNMAGFRTAGVHHVDLRPAAIFRMVSREYYATSARLVRYYENTRFVYEMEFKLQELRDAAADGASKPASDSAPKNTSYYQDPGGVNPDEVALRRIA
jgi:hypothetical protein